MPTINLSSVTKCYSKKKPVIEKLDLQITQGEFLTIMGPSGCGKTTLLRLIAGFEKPTSGEVLFDDVPVYKIAPGERGISMVFQDYALYNHMTVRKNLVFGLKERGMNKKQIEESVQETSELLGITHLLERKPRALSGGQKQRVAIGRAIIRKPEIIIFDEPFSNLDSVLCRSLQKELLRLHAELETTFIYVTHNKTDAFAMGTKVAIMKEGEIVQIGTPTELFQHPKNKFVANLVHDNKLNFLKLNSGSFVGISPYAFHVQSSGALEECCLTVVITRTNRLGKHTELICKLLDGQELKCILTGDYDISNGQQCELYYSSKDVYSFHSESDSSIV